VPCLPRVRGNPSQRPDADGHTEPHGNAGLRRYTGGTDYCSDHSDRVAGDGNRDPDTVVDADGITDADGERHTHRDAVADPESDTDCEPDADTVTDAVTHTVADTDADARTRVVRRRRFLCP